MMNIVFVSIW